MPHADRQVPGCSMGGYSGRTTDWLRQESNSVSIEFTPHPALIRETLLHLGEPLDPPPLAPARGPPTAWDDLVQLHDDRDAIEAAPDELPVIDIRSL